MILNKKKKNEELSLAISLMKWIAYLILVF